LDDHGIDDSWRIAPPLAAAGVDTAWCEKVAAIVPAAEALGPALDWVASTVSTSALLDEMKDATARISALVGAVKSYSQVDRASLQLIDVTEGIENTLAMLTHKLGDAVAIVRDYAPDLPSIEA